MGLHFSSAIEIARLVRERRVSAIDVLEHFLARVAKYDPRLNAIIWLDAERARERAKEADAALAKGQVWGPLHGVPMTIKESYNVAGSPTTWGDPKLRDNVTETSALAVERLKKAGVVLFGKTNVPLMLADHQRHAGAVDRPAVLGGLFQPRLSAFDRRSCRSHQVGTSGRLSGDSRKRPRQNSNRFQPPRRERDRRIRSSTGF
jgi:Amidase